MLKLRHVILVITLATSIAGCRADSETDIARDAEAQQQSSKNYYGVASNTDQNDAKNDLPSAVQVYAENAGYYLRNTINQLESLAPYLENNTLTDEERKELYEVISNVKSKSEQFLEQERPLEFDAFHDILISMLTEIDAFERILSDMRTPIHPLQVENARVYYENAILTHKQLEMEYQSLAEELGFY
ncbi:hypothetical protein [Halalkalibacter urbisdiaboli]|uniref:hypothetical protein n=1 Tax=Halalkalibacter urbisdiaboli TaxID=1960589 RepID=UPI000B434EC3|nr:hypothetical protein [Halalkalibacter urbisdiaboli]